MSVTINAVVPGSAAARAKIPPGSVLRAVNGHPIEDVLDYQYYTAETALTLEIVSLSGAVSIFSVQKQEYEDVGLLFHTYLMDQQKHCQNKCVFCFIDQLPAGLRESLYFKDDDSRLSFLFGNYITLTNMTQKDIDRIIHMKISPVNVSVHTTNPALRVSMMNHKKAGEVLAFLTQLASAGIPLNCQLVLCPGVNDGAELLRSLSDLSILLPALQSIAVVPVGLTKHRQGLTPIAHYTKETARQVIQTVEAFQEEAFTTHSTRLAFLADEFYLKADLPLPGYDAYEDFPQLENGVGLAALLKEDFLTHLAPLKTCRQKRPVSIATGVAAYPILQQLVDALQKKCDNCTCHIYPIENTFFGTSVDVAGLITGQDIITHLKGKDLGSTLLFPAIMLRREGDLFLDGLTPEQLSEALSVEVKAVKPDGQALLDAILGK